MRNAVPRRIKGTEGVPVTGSVSSADTSTASTATSVELGAGVGGGFTTVPNTSEWTVVVVVGSATVVVVVSPVDVVPEAVVVV
jgi:hypothetical protein